MTETNKSAFLTKSRIRNEQYETYKIKLLKTKINTTNIHNSNNTISTNKKVHINH